MSLIRLALTVAIHLNSVKEIHEERNMIEVTVLYTQYIRLGSDCNLSFSINARKIDLVESYKHLGHVINSAFDDREDIVDKRGAFAGQGNNVICYFNKLGSHVRQQLFDAYCMELFWL
jgi:hypothetical protein